MNKVIYYFTGTGNSMRAAEKIATVLGDAEIVSMRCNPADVPAADADMIGFVFPVYHWILPEVVQKFVGKLELNPEAYIFAVSVPSFINGKCFEILDRLLREKGTKLLYGQQVYCVANYVAMYPPLPSAKRRVPKAEKRLEQISADIVSRSEKPYLKANWLTNKLFPHLMPKHIKNLPNLDKYHHVDEGCISCGICSRICPCHNIEMKNGKPVFLHQCSQCMACISYCPKQAINFPYFTKKRKKYRNPYITAQELMLNNKHYG